MTVERESAEAFRTDWSASYNSRASRSRRFLCMTTPKVACSTVKRTLHVLEGLPLTPWWESHDGGTEMRLEAFTTDEVVEMLESPEWFRFAFARDPYARLFSAWKQKVAERRDTQYQPLHELIHERYGYVRQEGRPDPLIAFRDFADYIVTGADDFYRLDSHWSAQVDVIHHDLVRFDEIGRFESIVEDFLRILVRLDAPPEVLELAGEITNSTVQVPLAAAYDRDLADRVYEHYRRDFEAFGYPRDGWMYG
jgi:hypothetical protein